MATPEQFAAAMERQQQWQASRDAERAAEQAEQARMIAARKSGGRQYDVREQPTIVGLNIAKGAEEAQERQRLEAERIAAISPRQIWVSSLSYQEQQRIAKWEAVNKLPYPMPVGMEQQILTSRGVE